MQVETVEPVQRPQPPSPETSKRIIETQASTPQAIAKFNLLCELKGLVHQVEGEHKEPDQTESEDGAQETEGEQQDPGAKEPEEKEPEVN